MAAIDCTAAGDFRVSLGSLDYLPLLNRAGQCPNATPLQLRQELTRHVAPYLAPSFAAALARAPRFAKPNALSWNLAPRPNTIRRRLIVQPKRNLRDDRLGELFETNVRTTGYEGNS
jgi:hypothetical protein